MPNEIKVPPEALAQSYLRQADKDGTAAVVLLAFTDADGKQTSKMLSNRPPDATQKFLTWVQKADDRTIEAAAKALAAYNNLGWDTLTEAKRHNFKETARVVLSSGVQSQTKKIDIIV